MKGKSSKVSSSSMVDASSKKVVQIPGDGNCFFNAVLVAYVNAHDGQYPIIEGHEIRTQEQLRLVVGTYYLQDFQNVKIFLKAALIDAIKIGNFVGLHGLGLADIRNTYQRMHPEDQKCVDYQGDEITDELIQQYINGIKDGTIWGSGQELGILSRLLKIKIKLSGQRDPYNDSGDVDAQEVEIQYVGGNHYNVVVSSIENPAVKELMSSIGAEIKDTSHIILKKQASIFESLDPVKFLLVIQIIFNKREAEGKNQHLVISNAEVEYAISFLKELKMLNVLNSNAETGKNLVSSNDEDSKNVQTKENLGKKIGKQKADTKSDSSEGDRLLVRYKKDYEKQLEEIDVIRVKRIIEAFNKIAHLFRIGQHLKERYNENTPYMVESYYKDEFIGSPSRSDTGKNSKLSIIELFKLISVEARELCVHEGSLRLKLPKALWSHLESIGPELERLWEESTKSGQQQLLKLLEQLSTSFQGFAFKKGLKLEDDSNAILKKLNDIYDALITKNKYFSEYIEKIHNQSIKSKILQYILEAKKCDTNSIDGRAALIYLIQCIGEVSKDVPKGQSIYANAFAEIRDKLDHSWDNTVKAGKLIDYIKEENTVLFDKIKQSLEMYEKELREIPLDLEAVREFLKESTRIISKVKEERCDKVKLDEKQFFSDLKNLFEGKKKLLSDLELSTETGASLAEELQNLIKELSAKVDKAGKLTSAQVSGLNALLNKIEKLFVINEEDFFPSRAPYVKKKDDSSGAQVLYEVKQLQLMQYLINFLKESTEQDLQAVNGDYVKLRLHYNLTPSKHYFCLLILTAVGQITRNISSKEIFLEAGGFKELALELEFLKLVRNSLAHVAGRIQNADESGFIFSYFANDLSPQSIHHDGAKRVEFNAYLQNILNLIKTIESSMASLLKIGTENDLALFYAAMSHNQLLKVYHQGDHELMKEFITSYEDSIPLLTQVEAKLVTARSIYVGDIIIHHEALISKGHELNLEIIGLFGQLAKLGYANELDRTGLLVKVLNGADPFVALRDFKIYLENLLKFPIMVISEEQLQEFYIYQGEDDPDDKTKIAISHIREHNTLSKINKSLQVVYKLTGEDVDTDYQKVIELLQEEEINASLIAIIKIDNNDLLIFKLIEQYHYQLMYGDQEQSALLLQIIDMLFKKGADVNVQNKYGHTLLMYAVMDKIEALVDLLLQYNVDLGVISSDGSTALHYAVDDESFNSGIYLKLINAAAAQGRLEVGESKSVGTALHAAVQHGNTDSVVQLITRKVNLEARDDNGVTPLLLAISLLDEKLKEEERKAYDTELKEEAETLDDKSLVIVKLLIQAGAKVYYSYPISPISTMLRIGRPDLALTMLNNIDPSRIQDEINTADFHSHKLVNLALDHYLAHKTSILGSEYKKVFEALVSLGSDLNGKAPQRPLTSALDDKDYELAEFLIDHGARYREISHSFSILAGGVQLLQKIVSKGTRLDFQKLLSTTREHYSKDVILGQWLTACCTLFDSSRSVEEMTTAIRILGYVDITKEDGYTPLYCMLELGKLDIATMLLEAGANFSSKPKKVDIYGTNRIKIINNIANYNLDILQLLVQQEKIIWDEIKPWMLKRITNSIALSANAVSVPLFSALETLGLINIPRSILEKDQSKGPQTLRKYIELYKAIKSDNLEKFQALWLAYDGNKESFYKFIFDGKSLLHVVCTQDLEITRYVLDNIWQRDIDTLDEDDISALYYACEECKKDIVELLLQRGSRVTNEIINAVGDLDDRDDIIKMLLENYPVDSDINQQDDQGNTILHRAVTQQDGNLVKILLTTPWMEIQVNIHNYAGYTPLHLAIQESHNEIVTELCEHPNIDLNAKIHSFIFYVTTGCLTALAWSFECKNYEAIKILVKKSALVGDELMIATMFGLLNEDDTFLNELFTQSSIANIKSAEIFLRSWQGDIFQKEDYLKMAQHLTKTSTVPESIKVSLQKIIAPITPSVIPTPQFAANIDKSEFKGLGLYNSFSDGMTLISIDLNLQLLLQWINPFLAQRVIGSREFLHRIDSKKRYLIVDSERADLKVASKLDVLTSLPNVLLISSGIQYDDYSNTNSCADNTLLSLAVMQEYRAYAVQLHNKFAPNHLVTVVEYSTSQSDTLVRKVMQIANGEYYISDKGEENWNKYKEIFIGSSRLKLQEESLGALVLYDIRHSATESMTDFDVDSNSHIHSGSRVSAVSHKFYSTFEWHLKQIVYHKEISQFKEILQRNGIDRSIDILLKANSLDFKKSVLLKLHTDKGGSKEDFIVAQNLREKFYDPLDVKNLINDKIKAIQPIIHKVSMGFKMLDTVVDSVRFMHEPTVAHAKAVAFDSSYIYSMYYGVTSYSSIISTVDVLQLAYQEKYIQALKQAATTIGYMALPSLLAYTAIPHLGLAYGIGMATYTAYSAITNSYSFYLERTSDTESILRSTIAYRDLAKTLSTSSLQQLYDFASTTKGYDDELNNIALAAEKEALKAKLVQEKGEFGQKLYEYIYEPILEEKYVLLNKVLQGSITEEEAEALKAKHIRVKSDNASYEHCMEIRDIGNGKSINNVESNIAEHYYCYSDEKEVLDHIVVGSNNIQIIEHLF